MRQLSLLEAGLGLAEDYQQHGLLRFREMRVHSGATGRIDWPRTLHRTQPTPMERSVFYAEPRRRSLASHDDHVLTQLHAITIRDIFNRFFGQPIDLKIEPPGNNFLQRQIGLVMAKYRGRLYQEHQLSVVQMIEAYWSQKPSGARSIDAKWEYTEKFPNIWEEMCRAVISGGGADAIAWPSGRYVAADGQDLGAGLRLVTDFVRKVDGRVIVFDAKFYNSNALPDTYSVLKQLAYGFFLSREWHDRGVESDHITHVFLFPTHLNLDGELAHLRGQHTLTPLGRSVAMAAPIFLVYLDYGMIVNSYLRHSSVDINSVLRRMISPAPSK